MSSPMRTRGDLDAPRPWSPSTPDPDEPEPQKVHLRRWLSRLHWVGLALTAVGLLGLTGEDHRPWFYVAVGGGATMFAAIRVELLLRRRDARRRRRAEAG
jgi:hypothetical protein